MLILLLQPLLTSSSLSQPRGVVRVEPYNLRTEYAITVQQTLVSSSSFNISESTFKEICGQSGCDVMCNQH